MAAPRSVSAAVVGGIAAAIVASSVTVASAVPTEESAFFSSLNGARRGSQRVALAARNDLVAIARAHSREMAAAGDIFHSRGLDRKVRGCWTLIGENVGVGPDVSSLHDALMASPTHRANILGGYNQIGIGVAFGEDGSLYVTQVFAMRRCHTPRATVARAKVARPAAPQRAQAAAPARSPRGPGAHRASMSARSVDLLVRMVALDAPLVDPVTGTPSL